MQRCPYIHEMRERLLGEPTRESYNLDTMERDGLIDNRQSAASDQVGTVVKLHADGYHTSPAHQRTPLVPRDLGEDFNLDFDEDFLPLDNKRPKNAKKRVEFTDEDQKLQIIHRNHISIMREAPQFEYRKPVNIELESHNMSRPRRRISYTTDRKVFGPEFRTSLFIVTSLVYAMILIVVCIAYVISDVTTHRLPILYYEGFFTYLYGASILFLLYVFCFLLQESSCCNGGSKPKPPPKQKKEKKQKPKKGEQPSDSKDGGNGGKGGSTKDSGKGGKPSPFQEKFPKKKRDLYREQLLLLNQDSQVEAEAAVTPKNIRKRKTTQDDHTTGSFFLRVGAIAFGLGAMIYVGLEFGSFFEIPFTSKCHFILSGVNPLLQMVFIFMQMYFIFMNARLNIHRFKVLARFGLMHVVATNICVWIRTLVKESLHEITIYHQRNIPSEDNSPILQSIRRHALRHAGEVMGTHIGPNSEFEIFDSEPIPEAKTNEDGILSRIIKTTADTIAPLLAQATSDVTTRRNDPTTFTSTTSVPTTTSTTEYSIPSTTMIQKIKKFISSTTMATSTIASTTTTTTTTTEAPTSIFESGSTSGNDLLNQPAGGIASFVSSFSSPQPNDVSTTTTEGFVLNNLFGNMENSFQTLSRLSHDENAMEQYDNFDNIYPAALTSNIGVINSTACGRIDIMGTIVYDSAPYLYPFIIEYSLIGAVVLYVMWKHIGRYPRYMNEEDLEHRLEVMLSRRAVAMAQQARTGRVDCVGSSKGLFFGLLLLVGSMICLILFFVLVRHSKFELLAIYLADISHCTLMVFAILAIVIGFIRVKNLKFRCEEQSSLNDILLRISAFGLFIYSVFSVIAGSLKFLESEPNLLVMATGIIAVVQVIFQLLFIADVSRRRVHLPEHDRSKPGRQIVTFLLICNVSMFAIYTFEAQRVALNTVQLDFYGFVPWSIIQRVTLPLCIFHRFHSAVTLAEIWKTTYKARLE